jgi:hypothetical protein
LALALPLEFALALSPLVQTPPKDMLQEAQHGECEKAQHDDRSRVHVS